MSMTRQRLDAAMLALAKDAGVRVRSGVAVNQLVARDGCWRALLSDGAESSARAAVLATGKHDLRGLKRPAGVQSGMVALKMYWRLAPAQALALREHVELLLYPGGYAGLQSVQDGAANFSALMDRSMLARLGGWEGLLRHVRECCPQARERLEGATPLLDKPLAVSAIPYGFVRGKALGERLWAAGDQAAVIPSFTGDGMSIALYSGVRAAASVLGRESADAFQRSLGRELRWQVLRATALSLALVRQPAKSVVVAAVKLWPGLMRGAAMATRLSGMAAPRLGRAREVDVN